MTCKLCGNTHPKAEGYQHVTEEDLCPVSVELSERILEECLNPSYVHPHWTDPNWERDIAPIFQLRSYADYLNRKAFSDKPLSPREKVYLEEMMNRAANRPGLSKKARWKPIVEKKEANRRTLLLVKSDPGRRYDRLLSVARFRGWEVEITRDEWIEMYEEVVIPFRFKPRRRGMVRHPPQLPTWVGTLRELGTPEELGGLGMVHSVVRVDTSQPFKRGNLVVVEGIDVKGGGYPLLRW